MRRQLVTGLVMTVALILVLGLAYPLAVTAVSQVAFKHQANGSLVERGGVVVGSSLIGQSFTKPGYFHPRPSAAGSGYDALASGGSNLGPSSDKLLNGTPDDPSTGVRERIAAYWKENSLAADAQVPVDAVTASASGLDPHVSVANARIQALRVARVRQLPVEKVLNLVQQHTQTRRWGILGEDAVNVLTLNLALDHLR